MLVYTVCPVTRDLYLVLGQDAFGTQQWSDFGGGSKKETDVQCATRELEEETHGIFPWLNEKRVQTLPKLVFHFPNAANLRRMMHYTMFLTRVPFRKGECFQDDFDTAFRALPDATRAQYHVAEKASIRLVRLDDVGTLALRPFFRTRLDHAMAFLRGTVHFEHSSVFLTGYYTRAVARRVAEEDNEMHTGQRRPDRSRFGRTPTSRKKHAKHKGHRHSGHSGRQGADSIGTGTGTADAPDTCVAITDGTCSARGDSTDAKIARAYTHLQLTRTVRV